MHWRTNLSLFLLIGGVIGLMSPPVWTQIQMPPQTTQPLVTESIQTPSQTVEPPIGPVQTPPEKAQPPVEPKPEKQPQSPFALDVNGSLSWVLKYGLGDSRGLSKKGFATVLVLEQHIAVDIDGSVKISTPISGTLTISAQLDNHKSDNLQSLHMSFGNESMLLTFGDFAMGRSDSDFVASGRTLKGLEFTYTPSDAFKILSQAARVEGASQTLFFRGNTSETTTVFSQQQPDQPWLEQIYELNLQGLEYYALRESVVEGFTKVELVFPVSDALRDLLESYGLDFIYEQIQEEPATELERSNHYEIIVKENKYYLALKHEALDLLRNQIRTYINTHNEENDLTGDKAKSYPFSEDTEYEIGFLNNLAKLIEITTQEEKQALLSYTRGRFYYLGQTQITEDSVEIQVTLSGQLVDIKDPSLSETYRAQIFSEIGILDVQFPEPFFADAGSEIHVKFSYAVSGQTYSLGAIVKDSERVYLNDKQLQRNLDYQVEYDEQTGLAFLILLTDDLGAEDTLSIHFELRCGGIGGAECPQRSFIGGTLGWHPSPGFSLDFDLFRAADSPPPPEIKEQRNIMPNTHTVMGLSGKFDFDAFQSNFKVGFNQNVFPSGDPGDNPGKHTNQKENSPNQIHAITTFEHHGQSLVALGHGNGLTVFNGDKWESFGPAAGLSGSPVHSMVFDDNTLLIGTGNGLTQVSLAQQKPAIEAMSDRSSWKRFYRGEGSLLANEGNLPHNTVYALFIDEAQQLWVGTAEGLARVALKEIKTKNAWKLYNVKQFPALRSNKILSLNGDGSHIYIGTDQGLAILDSQTDSFEPVEETRDQQIKQLIRRQDNSLYGLTGEGIFLLTPLRLLSWVVPHKKTQAIAIQGEHDELWYGTSEGLFAFPQETPVISDRSITALGHSPTGLWVGPRALVEKNYELPIWLVESSGLPLDFTQSKTRINGRDERRFTEIDPAHNTDYGWSGEVATQLRFGQLQVSGRLEATAPEFLPVGREERRDVQQVVLGISYPLSLGRWGGSVTLSGQHTMGLVSLPPYWQPSGTMKDTFNLDWSIPIGLKLGFNFGLDQTENDVRNAGYDTQRYSYSVNASQSINLRNLLPLSESLSISGSYSLLDNQVKNKKESDFRDERITANSSLRLIGGLNFSGSYGRTSKARASKNPEGDQSYTWRGDWNKKLSIFSVTSSYSQVFRLKLTDSKGTRDDNATFDLRFEPIEFEDFSLTPGGSASFRMNLPFPQTPGFDPTILTLKGEGRIRGEWLDFSGQSTYRRSLSRDKNKKLEQLKDDLSATFDWEGLLDLTPGLDLGMNTETLHRLDKEEKPKQSARQSAGLHAEWEISSEMTNTTALNWQAVQSDRENSHTLTLSDKLHWTANDKLTARLESSASYVFGKKDTKDKGTNKFEGEAIAYADYQLGADMTASFTTGVLGGLDFVTTRNSYLSFIFSVQGTLLFGAGQRR